MAGSDKARNMGEKLKGKAKEVAGKATGDEKTELKGRAEQTAADARQAGEKARDTLKD
ncbi:CsbD family protein [Streptomyces termitum]|uniref:CsbD family protein n=1 Tax=Streptomyces termitum TaxID=67368 RepID=UPI0033A32A44